MATGRLPAQTVQTLCSFNENNGAYPNGVTLGSDGNFYGTTSFGGSNSDGTVFKITTNGTLTTLVSFNGSNGREPYAALTLGNDGNFYGTTELGGSGGWGTVFKMTTNGTLTTLVNFNNYEQPNAALTQGSDGNFYGTTAEGGIQNSSYPYGCGTVFKVTTNGTLTTLVAFNGSNGENPYAGLTLGNDGNFYGTTQLGGSNNDGTVFKVTTNGTLTTLVAFGSFPNGRYPIAALTLGYDGNFYGTAGGGSSQNWGTVFRVTTNGLLTTFFDFYGNYGEYPQGALTLGNDGNFYGTAGKGGSSGYGTVFKVTTSGALNTVYSFSGGSDDAYPNAALTLGSDGNFYGTTEGSSDEGSVFRLVILPVITSQPQSLTVTNGHAASFVVAAGNSPSLAYQWVFNGTNLIGSTNTTLSLQNAFPANAGAYSVAVTDAYGSITSNPAMLKVLPLGITAPTMCASGQFQFSFDTATGVSYAVQYSTNLTQWCPLVTLGGIGVPKTLIDTNAAGSQQRFYRIVLSPQ